MTEKAQTKDTARMLGSGDYAATTATTVPNKTKKILMAMFGFVVVVGLVIGLVVGVNPKINSDDHADDKLITPAHTVLKSSCESTLYPELCYSSLANEAEIITKNVTSKKDIIRLSINITMKAVQHNYATAQRLLHERKDHLTKREKGALEDCLETMDETLEELTEASEELDQYPNKKSLREHADDLKTLLSAAITNPETCLDGFSHDDADKQVQKELMADQKHVEKMCSNALAMICNMTNADIANQEKLTGRKLKEVDGGGWPEWLSVGDRRLLQSSTVKPNVVVAADGSGDYRSISEAVGKASSGGNRYIIRIKAGVYEENVVVPMEKKNIMFTGDGRSNTIITGSKNVVDGATTFNSATVGVAGDRFLARDITFQNTAGPSKHQAVALRVGGDFSAFYRCDILGYQDTLYVYVNRQFFVQCLISGTIDFIFGNSAVVFQNCDIHARRPNSGQKNLITAQGRSDPNQNTGIIIQKCQIGGTSGVPTFLGRPWKTYSRTVIMQSSISSVVNPAGWYEWSGNFALNTLFYGEYQNSGPGAQTSGRVKWKGFKVITSSTEAQAYTPGRFLAGSSWLSSTGFPFSLGF